ncbi:hypothetical protein [Rhodococcus erythropolis]|uniref:hypothetical protein n=1 Tax=Rhodococcus erythropolis TaxID=1833 RepID=UPI00159F5E86|nr:hypothetical protein [Rhodococcus erythropolis]
MGFVPAAPSDAVFGQSGAFFRRRRYAGYPDLPRSNHNEQLGSTHRDRRRQDE